MGRDWAESFEVSRRAFAEADEALGFPLSRLAWEGPEEELMLTANTQPALLASSIAIYRAVEAAGVEASLMAGHSLGEYTALVASGALAFADALRLVRRRGELMQEAVPVGEGAMAAVMGLDDEAVGRLVDEAAEGEVCAVANLNSPGQTVIAGHRRAVERAVALAPARGARKATLLKVSAPFHCPLMRPAREALAPLLAATAFADPRVPVVTNVDAAPVACAEAAREALVRQVDAPVRWAESVVWMAGPGRATSFLELSPSKVLSGLIRRTVEGVESLTLDRPEALAELVEA
jgi:[acyl-carrier-protein] S-malonyltransferase